ncbi:MAG: PorP/SprF family type IX secretion system membrane protein [Bacteroidales bacterium]
MKGRLYILILVMIPVMGLGQFNVPRLSQYLNNGLSVNPAYAGSREAFSFTGVSRSVYTGFEGNPRGFLAGVHSPIKKGNVALGLSIENSSDPGISNTGIYTHYAYRVWLGKMRLSMGLRAGLYNYSMNTSGIDLKDPGDLAFSSRSGFAPNFGAGLYLYNTDFFVGFSVPYFLNLPDSTGFGGKFDSRSYRYILTSGYLWDVSDKLKLKPSVMIEYSIATIDIQGGVNFIMFDDRLWLGALYRTTSRTVTSILEFQVSKPLRLGVAYDYSFTNISKVTNGSFEIMFRYELNYETNVNNPVYF